MFRRPSVHYGRTPELVTPYQKAAQVWDDRIGSARVQARNWRLVAFGNLFLAAGHYRNGVLLAPATGMLLSEWILSGTPAEMLAPFAAERKFVVLRRTIER